MKIKDHFLSNEIFELKKTSIDGILKTSPIPPNISQYYESVDYISHHQDSKSLKEKIYKFFQKFNLNYKRNILVEQKPKGSKVLDYGCGAGDFIKFISEDFETFGYEPDRDAKNLAEKKSPTSSFFNSLSEIPDHELDAITLWHVFEHIENQEDIVNLFYNKLKTNGLLIIAIPNYSSFDAEYYKEYWAAYDVPRHIFHISKNGMNNLFSEKVNAEKWKIKKIKPLLLDSFYISIMSEKYKKNPLSWLKGGIIGAISNFKASKNSEFSSLIYIIEKK